MVKVRKVDLHDGTFKAETIQLRFNVHDLMDLLFKLARLPGRNRVKPPRVERL
jgi:hypothetical protein